MFQYDDAVMTLRTTGEICLAILRSRLFSERMWHPVSLYESQRPQDGTLLGIVQSLESYPTLLTLKDTYKFAYSGVPMPTSKTIKAHLAYQSIP